MKNEWEKKQNISPFSYEIKALPYYKLKSKLMQKSKEYDIFKKENRLH